MPPMSFSANSLLKSLLGFSLALCLFLSPVYADKPLRIGFIGALTGPAAAYGIAAKNGMQMALDALPEDSIEVLYEDDQYSPAKSVAAFKKLTNIDNVDIVIGLASTPSNAVAPLAEKAGIPFIAWANDPKVARERNFVILAEQSALSEGKILAAEVVKREYKNIALISAVGDYQQAALDGLSGMLNPDLVVLQESVLADEKNFTPFLLKARQRKVGAIGMCMHPGQFGVLAKQAKVLGMKVPFFGCNMLQDRSEYEISEGALKDAWYVAIHVDEQFQKSYRSRFENDSVIPGAAIFYELTQLLAVTLNTDEKAYEATEVLARLLSSKNVRELLVRFLLYGKTIFNFLIFH